MKGFISQFERALMTRRKKQAIAKKEIVHANKFKDNFNNFSKLAPEKKETHARGPVHLKSLRQELNAKNMKNRRPS